MKTTIRSRQSREWNPTSNNSLRPIELSCVQWCRAGGRWAGFLLATCLALPFCGFSQWGLRAIRAATAWDLTSGSSNVVVAIIDTGVDYNHPDLAANMWRNPGETGLDANGQDKATNGIDDDGDGYLDDVYGINPADHNADPMPSGWHGFHGAACAGILGAVGNNALGIAGGNWSVRIMALRWGDSPSWRLRGVVSAVLENFEYVIQQRRRGVNVRVTSNS